MQFQEKGEGMSVKMMTMVFDRYPNGGGEMLLALSLADHASDDGSRIYPSIKSLAKKTRQAERSVQYQLRKMEEAMWLLLENSGNGGRNQHRMYCINPEWIKGADFASLKKGATDDIKGAIHNAKGATDDAKGCKAIAPAYKHPQPSVEPSVEQPSGKQRAAAPASPVLPDWLPEKSWNEWVEYRASIKAPLTAKAAELTIKKLAKLYAEGNDPVDVIDQSIFSGKWTDLYPIKNERQQQQPQRPTSAYQQKQDRQQALLDRIQGTSNANRSNIIDLN
jgi:hypothetical protein